MYTQSKIQELLSLDPHGRKLDLNSKKIDLLNLPVKSLAELFPPKKIISESTECGITFNILPNRNVKETLKIKEYRIWDRYIEAVFDREYVSEMKKSPDHLIFVTALIHMQKILYVYVCHEFGIEYKPFEEEKVKFWPMKVDVSIPKLIRSSNDIIHKATIDSIEKGDGNGGYLLKVRSIVDRSMVINGESPFFFIK
jgi:hypothetical protein